MATLSFPIPQSKELEDYTMNDFSKLTKIPLRDTWAHEAQDFTPWLEENIDRLGDALGLTLDVLGREVPIDRFSLDLLAQDSQSLKKVIIENQLDPADHKHLGQLLLYAAGVDASIIIWISEKVEEVHRRVLDWLNQKTDEDILFFAVVVEIVKIEDSKQALVFNPVVLPNEWQKSQKHINPELSPRHQKRKAYFKKLIDELREQHNFTTARKAQHYTYHNFASGIGKVQYGAMLRVEDSKAYAYIHIMEEVKSGRLNVYDTLHAQKDELQKAFDTQLEWQRGSEEDNFSRITVSCPGSIDADECELDTIREWHIKYLLKLKEIFHPEINRIIDTAEIEITI